MNNEMPPEMEKHHSTFDTAQEVMTEVPLGHDDSNDTKGFHLRWIRLHKIVKLEDQASGGLMGSASISTSFKVEKREHEKIILDQVSGSVAPGQVMAVMGPSGSGKTSLMNVLSGRASYQEGMISINGKVLGRSAMKKLMARVAYVKQADVFFEHLTVRDQLTYTALLRLPSSMSTEEKHGEVDTLISRLRLTRVADSPIMMISGGEKKRVNIGTELLTNPGLLLLDEPTSGLDSTSAVSLLKLLQELAVDQQKTVLTSIHQPSSAMFQCFDKLYMLSEGHVVYFGSPKDSLKYLEDQSLPCPPGYNAADHWMDLLVTDSAVLEEQEEEARANGEEPPTGELRRRRGDQAQKMASPRLHLQAVWDNAAVAEQLEAELIEGDDEASVDQTVDLGKKYPTGWWAQYRILMHRALKNSRSAIFTWLNLTKSLVIGVCVGLLWFQVPYTESTVYDISSYYFFTMTFCTFHVV